MRTTQSSLVLKRLTGRPTRRSLEAWKEETYGIGPAEADPRRRQHHTQSQHHRLLDRHPALLPADELHRLRATNPAAGGGDLHSPRLSRLLPGGALMGQANRGGADPCSGAGAAQGVGLRWLRRQPCLGTDRAPFRGRWPAGVGLARGHPRALGALVLLLAPPAGAETARVCIGHEVQAY